MKVAACTICSGSDSHVYAGEQDPQCVCNRNAMTEMLGQALLIFLLFSFSKLFYEAGFYIGNGVPDAGFKSKWDTIVTLHWGSAYLATLFLLDAVFVLFIHVFN